MRDSRLLGSLPVWNPCICVEAVPHQTWLAVSVGPLCAFSWRYVSERGLSQQMCRDSEALWHQLPRAQASPCLPAAAHGACLPSASPSSTLSCFLPPLLLLLFLCKNGILLHLHVRLSVYKHIFVPFPQQPGEESVISQPGHEGLVRYPGPVQTHQVGSNLGPLLWMPIGL